MISLQVYHDKPILMICSYFQPEAINTTHISQFFRWSGFLLCAIAMFLVIFPMFTFPKKLPPRHKKKKKKKFSADVVSDDDVIKEKSNTSEQVNKKVSSMGFGKNVRGKVFLLNKYTHGTLGPSSTKCGSKDVWLNGREQYRRPWVWCSTGPWNWNCVTPHQCPSQMFASSWVDLREMLQMSL